MTETETDRDGTEVDTICAAFAAILPGYERDVVAFKNALLAAHNRRVLASLAQQLRAGGMHVEIDGAALVLDVGKPHDRCPLERLFTATMGFFHNRRRRAAIRAVRP